MKQTLIKKPMRIDLPEAHQDFLLVLTVPISMKQCAKSLNNMDFTYASDFIVRSCVYSSDFVYPWFIDFFVSESSSESSM